MVLVVAGLEVRVEDRRGRLLGLEEQRIALVAALEEGHEAARPDAPDADDLEREVDEPVALDELATALGERGAIVRERLGEAGDTARDLDVLDGRRVVADPPLAIDGLGQRAARLHLVLAAGLGEEGLQAWP